jgi:hypothetical protein
MCLDVYKLCSDCHVHISLHLIFHLTCEAWLLQPSACHLL